MQYEVITAREQGRIVPRWQIATRKKHVGDFFLAEERDPVLSRTCRVAHLRCDPSPFAKPALILWDAIVLMAKPDLIVVTGFEQAQDNGGNRCDHAQTWVMVPMDYVMEEKARTAAFEARERERVAAWEAENAKRPSGG